MTTPPYRFSDPSLEQLALTHRSFGKPHNERLEWLGDSILQDIISKILYARFPNANEGTLSIIRTSLVCGEQLNQLARQLQLQKRVRTGNAPTNLDSILADALEAYLAAIYLDNGDVEQFITELYANSLQKVQTIVQQQGIAALRDAKSRLQEYLQHHNAPPALYSLVTESGEGEKKQFTMQCKAGSLTATATKPNKQAAEQAAALVCLTALQNNENNAKK